MNPLGKKFYEARHEELRGRVSKKRLAHIEGVAETAERLAREYGVDPKKARLAGLLHDWDKGYDDEGIRARAREVGLQVDPLIAEHMARTLHGPTAALALARDYPDIPADVLQAVDRHVTACIGMEPLDMVLFCADALEPNRCYGGVDDLRELVGDADLEDLFFRVLGYWIGLIIERCHPMHPDTTATWNHYAVIYGRKHPRTPRFDS